MRVVYLAFYGDFYFLSRILSDRRKFRGIYVAYLAAFFVVFERLGLVVFGNLNWYSRFLSVNV